MGMIGEQRRRPQGSAHAVDKPRLEAAEVAEAAIGGLLVLGEGTFMGVVRATWVDTADDVPIVFCRVDYGPDQVGGQTLRWSGLPWVMFAAPEFGRGRLGAGQIGSDFGVVILGREDSLSVTVTLVNWQFG